MSSPDASRPTIVLELARFADAGIIAMMSRALIEMGLRWTWTPQRVAREIRDRNTNVLVARAGSRVAGFAIMRYGDSRAHLNLLAVDPRYRRQGLGRRMIQWLEETALVAGVAEIALEVRANNPGARRFYAALGYVETGMLHGYYCGVETAVAMKRSLAPSSAMPPREQFAVWPIDH